MACYAARGLRILAKIAAKRKDADPSQSLWLAEAGLFYLSGAAHGNALRFLRRALRTCHRGQQAATANLHRMAWAALRRLEAQVLLRLRQYSDVFRVFGDLACDRRCQKLWPDLLVAPFRLRHDIVLLERLSQAGRLLSQHAGAAAALRLVLDQLVSQDECATELGHGVGKSTSSVWWVRVGDLDESIASALKQGLYNQMPHLYPFPVTCFSSWETNGVLNPSVATWLDAQTAYLNQGIATIDDFFTADVLSELWSFAREAPCFRTLRPGYLGAFPTDGCNHPVLRIAAESLEQKMPLVLAGHPLLLWWLFKHSPAAPCGVGLHADDAAVNVNIWLTPNSARMSGGGLEVFRETVSRGSTAGEFNRVFGTPQEEAQARTKLASGIVDHVAYKQNRAVIFASDRWHSSEPFEFQDEHAPRVNLTLLFGDRADAGHVLKHRRQSRQIHSIPDPHSY